MKTFPSKAIFVSILALSLSACSTIAPSPLSESELARLGSLDKAAAQADVEPVGEALTLEQALARALKFNLDRRAKMMEEALALGQ
ncbi:MAG: TolC family protein, partial [Burkholderiaceae bacterium]|nr:TolC family protein [Burkholderiaceae bacterium]